MLRSRRHPRYGAQLCALTAAVLLLLSVSLLHSRLSIDRSHPRHLHTNTDTDADTGNHLLEDADLGEHIHTHAHTHTLVNSEDRIDELDDAVQEETNPDDDLGNGSSQSDEDEDEEGLGEINQARSSGYFFDQIKGVIRRSFGKRSIDEWEDYVPFDSNFVSSDVDSIVAFGSDDIPVNENVREKMDQVRSVEDLLLLKNSPLRAGWGEWFDKKSDFLRRDRMFKSNMELLNPMNNPLLQDPDGVGTSLTRGDKLLLKGLLNEFKKVPFLGKKPLGMVKTNLESELKSHSETREGGVKNMLQKRYEVITRFGEAGTETKRSERRTLDDGATNRSYDKKIEGANEALDVIRNERVQEKSGQNNGKPLDANASKLGELSNVEAHGKITYQSGHIYADGKRWGYFPSLHPHLTFSNFVNAFFRKGKCSKRVFMVWNSPTWKFSVRHQRSLESLLYHQHDACVVIFSETVELDFFNEFLKDGFKVAVAMPNLDELLKDTPVHIFASFWFEWKKTKYYSTHYSELVRLAALYKYGGIYLDFDVVVLKPLFSLNNTVGLESEVSGTSLNGAVMAFEKNSPFIMECLMELYLTYDDTCLMCNGADLLTRVARNFLSNKRPSDRQKELVVQSSFVFFPISRNNITRFFTAPATESETAEQDVFFKRILDQSFTFHLWNSLTSPLVPEPESLVARLINHPCIRCSDVL